MENSISRIKIFSNTDLIETMGGNSDVQLRKSNDGYYMTSPTTGNHFIVAKELDDRVKSHWDGFKINQKS